MDFHPKPGSRRAGSLLSSVEAQIVLGQVENGDEAGATPIKLVYRESWNWR